MGFLFGKRARRQRMRSVLAAGCLVFGVVATGVVAQEATPVGPEEVQNELVGKVWEVELPNGQPAVEHFNADGTVRITGGLNDRGYWRLWAQGYCTQWYRMRNGAERCFTLDRTADGKIRVWKPDGEISMTILSTKPIE
jgi:hypothetical protein